MLIDPLICPYFSIIAKEKYQKAKDCVFDTKI